MKSLFTSILLIFSAITFAQIPSYVPSNGLVGWWPFNGNANDESGNGNNGTVNGATLTADRFGVADKAYSFDGVDDYLSGSLGNITSANVITVSAWMKYNGNAGGQPYDLYFQLGQYGSHTLAYAYNYNSNLLDLHSNCFSNPYYNINLNNDWHNVIVIDSFTITKVYVDAVLVTSFNSGSNQECFLGSNFFLIGGGADNQYVTGDLDDIGIWNRALTACEIHDLYTSQLGSSNTYSSETQSAIDSYTWPVNGQTYTQSGVYTDTLVNASGCDSVITLNLELDFTGIQSHTNTSLQLYPNPVKDVMTLVGLKGKVVSFAVYSVDGKLIKSGQTSGEIQLEDLEKGNYILKIDNEALPFVKL